ncbi:MAG TPA: transcription-repair coupling factor [Tepidisphaeraceae bacterium]|jgi:transcription-repair coupling factor (superfamily II helicase)
MNPITSLPDAVRRLVHARALKELATAVAETGAVSASGIWGSSVAAVTGALAENLHRPIVLICGHIDEADDLADDMELFHGRRPDVLPTLELAGALGKLSEEQVSNRLQLVARLAGERRKKPEAEGMNNPAQGPGLNEGRGNLLLVAPIQAVMQAVPSIGQLSQLMRTVSVGQTLEVEKLIVWLSEHGYNRLDQVEVPGDFAVRGGIVDVYLPGDYAASGDVVGLPVRIDFFDDQVESIRKFDPETMGSLEKMESVRVVDLKGQMDSSESTSVFSHLPDDAIVVLWGPLEIAEQAKSYLDRLPDPAGVYPLSAILQLMEPFARLELSQFDQGAVTMKSLVGKEPNHVRLPVLSLQRFETEAKKAIRELAELAQTHDVSVFCENPAERQRFSELLETEVPGLKEKVATPIGYLHRGFVWNEDNAVLRTAAKYSDGVVSGGAEHRAGSSRSLALLGHHELFHRYEQRRRVTKVTASRPVDSFLDLKVGDYVVHVAHGIARFMGMQTLTKDGKSDEYLSLRFADNASLHVPAARINLIQKYIGGFSGHPQLSRLGSGAWEKQKEKVSEAVMDMAAEMLQIQAAREAQPGMQFPPDTQWQKEFEAEFPYEPTGDQLTSSEEIKQDMQKRRPMDRLLCGDVGYGKTELAMRAAFKAAEYGKQVAVLVPTTVLAEQHYRTFKERMANYPMEIDYISRFKSNKAAKETLTRAAHGDLDILIGTHRLLSKDVKFADLGLVVVDEEQRFGVTHKERLKQLRTEVDVLTMSATPIPRTLHMSMLGLRDISSLTQAPQDRRSVVTEVMPFDKQRIKMAIERELAREGQVYFVHNRVSNIIEMADQVQQLVPNARIIVGHGQMEEGELEQVMLQFIRHEADILVCTTIIESGLDIANANTIFINQADRFGLSELHQLRGRVGRWKHRAYCYLLLPADRPVTPVAAKRLKAIEEYSHLGAGFKIAMRDLELRGAGNFLGPEQSGHIATVGYEMYCQLLEEATRQLKNEAKPISPEAHVDLSLSAFIPKTYITADRQRMDLYRRLTRCTSIEMLAGVEGDMKDAFGEPPHSAILLIALTELRLLAAHFGIDSMIKKDPDIVLNVRDAARAQLGLIGAPGTLRVVDEKTIYLRVPATYLEPETALMVLRNLMRQAYDREKRGEAAPTVHVPPPEMQKAAEQRLKKSSGVRVNQPIPAREPSTKPAPRLSPQLEQQLTKLDSLRDSGILTEEEFLVARQRLLAKASL